MNEPLVWRVLDSEGRTKFVADPHRGDGKRNDCADEKVTGFLEPESAIRAVHFIKSKRLITAVGFSD